MSKAVLFTGLELNNCEETFVILDGEAQFTVDASTSLLKDPVGAPARMGRSHPIYNPRTSSFSG